MTKKAAEEIDQTRMDMAGMTGLIEWINVLADRNGEGDLDEIKEIAKEQSLRLVAMRKRLNGARFDNSFSPLGFELGS